MSGHSKWANIKRRKGKQDEIRGKIFTKIAKEIFVAVKQGGPDPDGNFRLKLCIQKAKANNMPVDNINRSIQKAAGNSENTGYDEIFYEGYAAGGIAVLCEILTDNRNRTASEVRYLFSRNNGNLGETGCVAYMFHRKGRLTVNMADQEEEELMMAALDAGAEDMTVEEEEAEIITPPELLEAVKSALESAGIPTVEAEITMLPETTIEITDADQAQKVLNLIEALEDNDDIQNVYHNAEIPDEIMEALE